MWFPWLLKMSNVIFQLIGKLPDVSELFQGRYYMIALDFFTFFVCVCVFRVFSAPAFSDPLS